MKNKCHAADWSVWKQRALSMLLVAVSTASAIPATQAQVAIGNAVAPPVAPLNAVGIPDVNTLGLLDGTGPNALGNWPIITQQGKKTALQQLGKALFWDMQVGGDGIQSCASCHYHAGADNRKTNQLSPGLKGGDLAHDLSGPNATLTTAHYSPAATPNRGLPVSEAAKITAGATPDAPDGLPGVAGGKPSASVDVNDVVSSQGVRGATHIAVVPPSRVDSATLADPDPGFNVNFSSNDPGIPDTARRVEPRNSPTVLNAVYNMRSFWDGRADTFFNGISPLGFRDPDAKVKVFTGGALGVEQLAVPFSSLASQAVGPIESDFEMVFAGRPHRQLGKKLAAAQPLAGQLVACSDSMLGALTDCATPGTTNRGLSVAPAANYRDWVRSIFDQRFWGDGNGNDVCLDAAGAQVTCGDLTQAFTLFEWNFSMFFGLSVQAYEATLHTGNTIVDLIVGGVATGTLTAVSGKKTKTVNTFGLPLAGCVAGLAFGTSAAQVAAATNVCTAHYAKFIHPKATSGSESATAPNPVPNNSNIGGCTIPVGSGACAASPNLTRARATLLNVDRGLGRFFAGATGCSVCHFNPEFTGATVATITGFGAGPPELVPPGQIARLERRVAMERMVAFNGAPTVYDTGFYNIGVRPTPEDSSLGANIKGVPLAYSKIVDMLNGGGATASAGDVGLDTNAILTIGQQLGNVRIPTSPTNLAPVPFTLAVACGPGVNGGVNANNNPANGCVTTVIPGERLLRNGAFKAQGLRNVKFTGPYFHNGSKMNLRQVLEFYKTAGSFPALNFNNLDAGIRTFALGAADESAVVELLETGLTDWRVAFEEGKFDHPEICVPHGHDPVTGKTKLVEIAAVGATGNGQPLQTFEEQVLGIGSSHVHNLAQDCGMPAVAAGQYSTIDVPPAGP